MQSQLRPLLPFVAYTGMSPFWVLKELLVFSFCCFAGFLGLLGALRAYVMWPAEWALTSAAVMAVAVGPFTHRLLRRRRTEEWRTLYFSPEPELIQPPTPSENACLPCVRLRYSMRGLLLLSASGIRFVMRKPKFWGEAALVLEGPLCMGPISEVSVALRPRFIGEERSLFADARQKVEISWPGNKELFWIPCAQDAAFQLQSTIEELRKAAPRC